MNSAKVNWKAFLLLVSTLSALNVDAIKMISAEMIKKLIR